jgi:hypothetical protein
LHAFGTAFGAGNERAAVMFSFVQAFRFPPSPATMNACAGHAKVAELVDALDLGSSEGDLVHHLAEHRLPK